MGVRANLSNLVRKQINQRRRPQNAMKSPCYGSPKRYRFMNSRFLDWISIVTMPHSSIESIPRNLSPLTYGAGFSLTRFRIFLSYAARSFLNKLKASACAGDSGFGSSKSDWMPSNISLIVIAGFQPSSSLRIERQTVPEGYTFGWKSGGTNLPELY